MYPPINNQQPHTNSIKVYEHPLILLKKKFPPSSVRPWNTAHPKAADAAASFFDPGGEFSKKKLRPQFSSLRPHQDQGLVPQSPCNWGCGVVEEDEVVCFLSAKKNLNLHKNGRSGTWKCDAFLSAKKHVVLLSWNSGLLHICSHHWSNCIIWILAFISRLPKGKAIGVHVGEVHSVKLHLEISKGEPNQTKNPPAHNSNHTRHFPDLSSRKYTFESSESGFDNCCKNEKTLPFGSFSLKYNQWQPWASTPSQGTSLQASGWHWPLDHESGTLGSTAPSVWDGGSIHKVSIKYLIVSREYMRIFILPSLKLA